MMLSAQVAHALVAWGLLFGVGMALGEGTPPKVPFNREIRPILSDRCFACHGPDRANRQADLRLDRREDAVASAIKPGDSQSSELLRRLTCDDDAERMPPIDSKKTPLTQQQIDLLARWIDEGAEYEDHWSLVPPRRHPIPTPRNHSWTTSPVDSFLLAPMELASVAPSSSTDPASLLRRLSFDLNGLPPSSAEVRVFLGSEHPDKVDREVDRLLASSAYAERMAIYWLDLVRYADTVGYHGDQEHHISPYRDYVIEAFNRNMPFDQFTREQLAGDLLPDATIDQQVATAYNRVLQTSHEGGVQAKEYLAKYASDRVRNLSATWMGATLGCAECHDHKFDEYSQKDFYRLEAFFADIEEKGDFKGAGDTTPTKRFPEIDVVDATARDEIEVIVERIAQSEKQVEELTASISGSGSTETPRTPTTEIENARSSLEQDRKRLEELKKRSRRVMVTRSTTPRTIRVLSRGDWMDESGEVVEPGFPGSEGKQEGRLTRLDLANWLTRPDHPQTSRVFVNRLWYLFHGAGLSRNLEDMGSQGEWPTHPELLDWLACEFVDRGWDVKSMVRSIVTTEAYRQSTVASADSVAKDPNNILFSRQSSSRWPAEMIRDQALAVSGLLVNEIGGRSVRPYQPVGYYKYLNFPEREYKQDEGSALYRRGLYTHWQRQYLHPVFKAFDAPSREECTAQRAPSNTPAAALALLNAPEFVEAARAFAQRILREGGDSDESRLSWAWFECLGRTLEPREASALLAFLIEQKGSFESDLESARQFVHVGVSTVPDDLEIVALASWTSVARAMFNLDEAVTRN